jgi:hypothetical protein
VRRYEQLTSGSEVVESRLKEVLPEFLNAEVVLRTVGDVSQAGLGGPPTILAHIWKGSRVLALRLQL